MSEAHDRLNAALPGGIGADGMARCTAHPDGRPSLHVTDLGDRIVLKCFAGCQTRDILDAVGLKLSDLYDKPRQSTSTSGKRSEVARYTYTDENGEPLYDVVRWEPKHFTQEPADGKRGKGAMNGVRRVLYNLPSVQQAITDRVPVWVVEGEKDADALMSEGQVATTAPMGAGKWRAEYNAMLKGADVIVCGDNDEVGRRHARDVATQLCSVAATVEHRRPADGFKDIADHIGAGVALGQTQPVDENELRSEAAADNRRSTNPDNDDTGGKVSQATQLVKIAQARYTLGRSDTGEAFAVPINGPRVPRLFRGSKLSLRAELAGLFMREHGKAASASALADAMLTLEGFAQSEPPTRLALRVAECDDITVLDLGRDDGKVVTITPGGGWEVVDESPVLFRRTELTGELPEPVHGALDDLRALFNVTAASWPPLLGWLVAVFLPNIAHPAVLLTGPQGTGKTTTAKTITNLIDASPSPTRTAPKDPEQWAVSASGSFVVAVDNISTIPPWFSDALCRAVTGDGLIRRRLYTDSELSVLTIRRCIILTAIDPGALRGDLADRLLTVELEPITPGERRAEHDIIELFDQLHARALGALLDVAAGVLGELPGIRLESMPRMADFARALAALDKLVTFSGNMGALEAYEQIGRDLAADVVTSDPVADAISKFIAATTTGEWRGTASDLLLVLPRPDDHQKNWPTDATRLSAWLKRAAGALAAIGISVEFQRRNGVRTLRLSSAASSAAGTQSVPLQVPLAPNLYTDEGPGEAA